MYKNSTAVSSSRATSALYKFFLIMKLTTVLLLLTILQVSASSYAQKITLKVNKMPMLAFFAQVQKQTGYDFLYNSDDLKKAMPITVNIENMPLKDALNLCFSNQPLNFYIDKNSVLVKRKEPEVFRTAEEFMQNVVTGKVTDIYNLPFPGVAIREKGGTATAVSDIKGSFKITVSKATAVLIFSFIGYDNLEVEIANQKNLNVVLKEKPTKLDEVVVVGYGTVNKKDLTGAVAEVKVAEIVKAPVTNFEQALAGRVSGVQVSSNDDQPGSGMNIVIRGGNSLTQSNAPLYVVDGFPIENFSSSSLNPQDIESISILKDASATAIYGSRGANGVIIVETKKGKLGKPEISYKAYAGKQFVTKKMEMMNPYEFVKYQLEVQPNEMEELYITKPKKTLEDYRNVEGIDWQGLLFRGAAMNSHDLAIRGATPQTKYSFSGSYVNQDGVVINSGYKRTQARVSIEQTVTPKLKANLNVNYSLDKNYGSLASLQQSSSNSYASFLMYRTLGYRPVSNEADIVNELFDTEDEVALALMNPYLTTQNEIRQQTKNGLLVNAGLVYSFSKNLTLNIRGGLNTVGTKDEAFYNSKTYKGLPSSFNVKGVNGAYGNSDLKSWVNENTLTYKKNFGKNNLDLVGGVTFQQNEVDTYGFESTNIPNEDLKLRALQLGLPAGLISVASKNALASAMARANYSINSKYLFTASIRLDGSSKFAATNRWGVFPSGAFAWQMGREDFIKRSDVISDAKLRISYGISGNNRIGDFARYQNVVLSTFFSFNNQTPEYIAMVNNMGNEDLKWEKTAQLDIGYDLSLFKNRINLNVDVYSKITRDLLLNSNLPLSTGFSTVYKNVGKIKNQGLELTLNTVNINNKTFRWETEFNISFNRNRILELAEHQEKIQTTVPFTGDYNGTFLYLAKIDQPAAQFYGYEWLGNYQYEDFDLVNGNYVLKAGISTNGNTAATIKPGDIKYKDQNGDGIVNDNDAVVIGRALPIHYGGFTNNFTYKNFSLSVFMQWNYGNQIMNANRLAFEGNFANRANFNQFASYINRWSPENQNNENFRVGGFGPKGRYSTRTLEDGSFLRLKTVNLSYNLPKKTMKKISGLEIFAAAQNLYTWTKYSGFDPEVSTANSTLTPGFDYSAYPRNFTVTLGARISL
ncbi:TonB-linked outer membrane protein, SusC/RagA family [Pedobacter sp. ok626]|nr:TonB-linked outer membrane protein, SusC/RagA family [Pedobacter sp. ok626]